MPETTTSRATQWTGNVLVTWIGTADTKGVSSEDKKEFSGPIATLLQHYDFTHIFMLFTTAGKIDVEAAQKVKQLVQEKVGATTYVKPVDLSKQIPDPTDLEAVYNAMSSFLKKKNIPPKLLHYNLTSGTGTMYGCQLLMSNTSYPGTALYTKDVSKYTGEPVREVRLPSYLAWLREDNWVEQSDAPFTPACDKAAYKTIEHKIAPQAASVLITGETGVGKTHLARFTHDMSRRRGEFVPINCAELTGDHNAMRSELFGHVKGTFTGADSDKEGAFKRADGGTLFLDEVGEIPMHLQGMLLTALDPDGNGKGEIQPWGGKNKIHVDVRIIAATNIDLLKAVQEKRFRQDLYFRLAQYTTVLTPVRKYARTDKQTLLEIALQKANRKYGKQKTLSNEALQALIEYKWPGNIREVFFRIASIVLLSEHTEISREDVDVQLGQPILFSQLRKSYYEKKPCQKVSAAQNMYFCREDFTGQKKFATMKKSC